MSEGEPIFDVLQTFEKVIQKANFIVAHNISFDEKVVGAEFIRNGMSNSFEGKNKICTMERTTYFCAIQSPNGGYKWPTLSQLYFKLFGNIFEDAHNAASDTEATAKCFWELKRIGEL
jgi:DNA polymerase III epsilon subunit-like protein